MSNEVIGSSSGPTLVHTNLVSLPKAGASLGPRRPFLRECMHPYCNIYTKFVQNAVLSPHPELQRTSSLRLPLSISYQRTGTLFRAVFTVKSRRRCLRSSEVVLTQAYQLTATISGIQVLQPLEVYQPDPCPPNLEFDQPDQSRQIQRTSQHMKINNSRGAFLPAQP